MAFAKKGTKLYSILNLKCPRCHEGDLFNSSNWSFKDITIMPDNCPNCGQSNMPEPGFYYGAMYVSYVLWGVFCLVFGGISIMFFGLSVNQTTLMIIAVSAVFFIPLFRVSRAIWFNWNVSYNP